MQNRRRYVNFKIGSHFISSLNLEGKLQRENKLISYERVFKMLENGICISLESVKPFSSY